ncbi:nucleotidyl transferase AbiEii/AbiGii toxin family protein [Nocardia nova]|uniref:nucleotidyl transferase AbiEii/AbiGii toxin family protein n=1 Tax=Nocardia nova TaxID=37330 RepID=UPI0031843BEF
MVNDELESVAVQFGVSPEQVERDHLISHLLAAISRGFGDRLHFIGGTALARTHLVNGRLSEDIDLVALDNRTALGRNSTPLCRDQWRGPMDGSNGYRR